MKRGAFITSVVWDKARRCSNVQRSGRCRYGSAIRSRGRAYRARKRSCEVLRRLWVDHGVGPIVDSNPKCTINWRKDLRRPSSNGCQRDLHLWRRPDDFRSLSYCIHACRYRDRVYRADPWNSQRRADRRVWKRRFLRRLRRLVRSSNIGRMHGRLLADQLRSERLGILFGRH
jgi:hypothetical protein